MAKRMYDPWQNIKTRNGYYADEVISALQKSIRRVMKKMHVSLHMNFTLHHQKWKKRCGEDY